MLLDGKVAIITGVGPGMGKAIALLFARHGAKLAIGAQLSKTVDEVAEEIRGFGGQVTIHKVDRSDKESCQAIVDSAVANYGHVDILVQNGANAADYKRVEDADPKHWRAFFESDVMGAVYLFQACLPSMKSRGDGRIVLINTGAANNRPSEGLASYAASKGALASLVRSIAVEAGQYGIRCNGVHLDGVDGKNYRNWIKNVAAPSYGMTEEQYLEMRYREYQPLRYIPPADECAGTVLFLASDLARPVTGQAISVNGGEWFGK